MANWITIARFPLLIVVVLLLHTSSPLLGLVSALLIAILIAMDSVDGLVARARDEVSLLGSVLDIMADRSVELVLWVCYANLGLVPVAIPIIYILRGTVVDSLRSVHVRQGQAPFKAMRTSLGSWLVGSSAMRSSYGVIKLISFVGLAVTNALVAYAANGAIAPGTARVSNTIFAITSWISVVFCLARGIPVIVEALLTLKDTE
jgi:CDP-diacylglycerol--glycerol-3-phosphate 3-phosphatidyltransferase